MTRLRDHDDYVHQAQERLARGRRDAVRALLASPPRGPGMSYRDIAEEVGVSATSIWKWAHPAL